MSISKVRLHSYFCAFLILVCMACNGPDKQPDVPKNGGTRSISYSIIGTFPHDTSSFTQGLIVYKGELYEGTGLKTRSKLMKIDMATGKPTKSISLDSMYFGEGVTILRDTIYQLTWEEKVVFVYDLNFRKIKQYKIDTEGWGLTTDGQQLIVSDGTSNLYFYDPSTFQLLRTQTVTEDGSLSYNLNELEFIDGYIYANQLNAPYILKIDPVSGFIVGKANLDSVWTRIKAIDPAADVPNGIAYDTATKKTYITGKLWPELYEIQFAK